MAVYCTKKICTYNSACCSFYDENADMCVCKLEDILIDDQVECSNFKAEYNKIETCINCSRRTGIITLNPCSDIKVNIKPAPDYNKK